MLSNNKTKKLYRNLGKGNKRGKGIIYIFISMSNKLKFRSSCAFCLSLAFGCTPPESLLYSVVYQRYQSISDTISTCFMLYEVCSCMNFPQSTIVCISFLLSFLPTSSCMDFKTAQTLNYPRINIP